MLLNRKKLLAAFTAVILLVIAFIAGFVSCMRLRTTTSNEILTRQLATPGNATSAVRDTVLTSLRAFQDGYAKRDQQNLGSFMSDLFPKDDDVLILGTEGGAKEWVRGRPAAARFIATDWQHWGELQLDVAHAEVWSSGDVAWVATIGTVRFAKGERPLRLMAVLARESGGWVFRQLHFQWDENLPDESDLLHARTYLQLARLALQ